MKRIWMIALLILLTGLAACRAKEDPVLSGIVFERGHGSMWGNQFYIDVNADQVNQLRFVSDDTQEPDTRENIPVLPEQWRELEDAVKCLDLKEEKDFWLDKIVGQAKLDGGEYRKLTLRWKNGDEEIEINYKWTQSQHTEKLEALLEQLAQTQPPTGEATETTTGAATEETTEPITQTAPEQMDRIGLEDTYWVASEWYSEGIDEAEVLQPEVWALDLMVYTDGTARFRDIHESICLVDDSHLNLSWERTAEGELLFYSRLYTEPVLRGTCENGVLYLRYSDGTLVLAEKEIPKGSGQIYSPAELVGTWLLVSGETEGYQWEAMPNELSSLVFRVTSYDGALALCADRETLDRFGEMTDAAHYQEVSVLNEALYDGCENGSWSVRIGQESPKDAQGYPTEAEYYATLLDYNTLLLQQYYTLDGAPAVSYQTYWRFPELVTWRAPEYIDLEYTNWVCTEYVNTQGEKRSPPAEMEDFSLLLCSDQTCVVSFGADTAFQGTWQVGNGGVMLLRSDEDVFWFGGVLSAYCVETDNETADVLELSLYFNGGILKLQIAAYG